MTVLARLRALSPQTIIMLSIPLALASFLCINLAALLAFGSARIDLTDDRLYTVSPSTKQVLEQLEEPITLRFFLSSALIAEAPDLRGFADQVRELLSSYELMSDGNVRIEEIDPVPFSSEEDRAIAYNLRGFNINRAGEQGYFGLVGTNSVDGLEVMEALTPSRDLNLEYDISRMVLRLSRPTEPKIAVFDGVGIFGSVVAQRRPSALIERLGEDFELAQVAPGMDALPEDIDALMVVHPHSLSANDLYLVDQYVMNGGPALVFVDPLSENSPPSPTNPAVPAQPGSYFDPLLPAWGLTMPKAKVLGDMDLALEIRGTAGQRVIVADYPPWLVVQRNQMNSEDPITRQLGLMRMSTTGVLETSATAETEITPLISSTSNTMLYDQAIVLGRPDPRVLVDSFVSSGHRYPIAVRVTGEAGTAFPDGPPQNAATGGTESAAQVMRSVEPLNVVVVADSDMLADDLNVNPSGVTITQNTEFVLNALDSLVGGDQLVGLRGRGLTFRPFTRIDEIEAAADARYRSTETRLQAELEETQERLDELRLQTSAPNGEIGALNAQQQDAVQGFNQRMVELRRELRDVRGALRAAIDSLSNQLRLINILAVPLLVVLVGLIATFLRRRKLARYLATRQSAGAN